MKDLRDLKSRYEFQLDNKQLVLLFAGMIVILILAFILGTLFGRNLYSAKTAESPTPVAAAPAPASPAPSPGGTAAEEMPAVPVSPEEKEKQELVKELEAQKLPSPPPGTAPATPEAPAAPAKPALPGKTVAEIPAGPATKTPKPETAMKPEPSPLPASGSGPFCIQIASSQNRGEADSLKTKLAEKKFDAYLLKAEIPGKGTFYRVRVGHYKDRAQAEKALRILKSHEPTYKDAFVTK